MEIHNKVTIFYLRYNSTFLACVKDKEIKFKDTQMCRLKFVSYK